MIRMPSHPPVSVRFPADIQGLAYLPLPWVLRQREPMGASRIRGQEQVRVGNKMSANVR